ncbi:MAG: hypothetical protein QM296_05465 [Bacillota bacterium]|nr:hypothetical protein [Bacillota bacterium]
MTGREKRSSCFLVVRTARNGKAGSLHSIKHGGMLRLKQQYPISFQVTANRMLYSKGISIASAASQSMPAMLAARRHISFLSHFSQLERLSATPDIGDMLPIDILFKPS